MDYRIFRQTGFVAATLASTLAAVPAIAQEATDAAAMTLDERVNQIFANSTGWFVNLIF